MLRKSSKLYETSGPYTKSKSGFYVPLARVILGQVLSINHTINLARIPRNIERKANIHEGLILSQVLGLLYGCSTKAILLVTMNFWRSRVMFTESIRVS